MSADLKEMAERDARGEAFDTPVGPPGRTVFAEDDWVAVETECFATLGNGRQYNNLFHFAMRLEDGQIIEIHEYYDYMYTHRALFAPALDPASLHHEVLQQ